MLYLTESLLIYNNSSLKLDSIINFPSYQSFTRGSARGSTRGFYGLCISSIGAVYGALLKALLEALLKALHKALLKALHEALLKALCEAPLKLRIELYQG